MFQPLLSKGHILFNLYRINVTEPKQALNKTSHLCAVNVNLVLSSYCDLLIISVKTLISSVMIPLSFF